MLWDEKTRLYYTGIMLILREKQTSSRAKVFSVGHDSAINM